MALQKIDPDFLSPNTRYANSDQPSHRFFTTKNRNTDWHAAPKKSPFKVLTRIGKNGIIIRSIDD